MDPLTASALISGSFGLFSGLFSNKSNRKAIESNNNLQMDLAKYQYDRNVDFWKMNNEYNTPASQMERYKAAGLNPNLIYSQGSSGNSGYSQMYDAPNTQPVVSDNSSIISSTQLLMNGILQAAQIENINAKTRETYQNIANLRVDNSLKHLHEIAMGYSNAKSKVESEVWQDLYWSKLSELDSRAILNRANSQNVDSNRLTTDALRPLRIQQEREQLNKLLIDVGVARQLEPYQLERFISDISYTKATTSSRELENKITRKLIDTGINLRGSALERVVSQIVSFIADNKDNLPYGLGWLGKAASYINN